MEVKIWARIIYVCEQSGDPVNAAESDGFLGKKKRELYLYICMVRDLYKSQNQMHPYFYLSQHEH